MSAKKLLLATIGVVCLQTSVQGEEWGLVKCLRECTNVSCADVTKQEMCKTNCAHNLGSIDACLKAKPQASSQPTKPTPPPRRVLPQQPQPQPSPVEPEIKGGEEQTQPEKQGSTRPPMQKRQAMAFSKPPLEKTPSTVGHSELKKQPSSKAPQRPTQPLPTSPSLFTYTADEVNHLLKGLLNDQIKEITTGCDSAIGKIHGGLEMVKVDQNADAIDLMKRGTGFIALFMNEKKDAIDWVETFDISKHLSEEDLKKYGIKKEDVNFKDKLSLDVLKKIYQKSQEKSLLVSQDCKVKSAQFQGWLEAYLAKRGSGDENTKKKQGFLRRGESKK